MHHVAIMKRSWHLLEKILSGEKTIESRWYKTKALPWNRIHADDTVFFKNSGEPIQWRCQIAKVRQFENLTPRRVIHILEDYGKENGIGPKERHRYYSFFKDKRYCILLLLRKPELVTPFEITKKGFGAMAAWITIDSIDRIRLG